MANRLFQELDLHNKPSRNGFDLSHRVNFTAKCGELLPIAHHDVIFGDKWRIDLNHFSRTAPADTAAAVKIREYFDVFFVPYRLLWKNAPAVHTQNTKNPVTASSPITNLPVGSQTPQFLRSQYFGQSGSAITNSILYKLSQYENAFGYNRAMMSSKLMNYLGYGYTDSLSLASLLANPVTSYQSYAGPQYLSLYPLLAYQCIYYNFFRNAQWEDNQPYNYNVDYLGDNAQIDFKYSDSSWSEYWSNPTIFDLQYANYPKDLFFGFFPDAQYGDEATVNVDVVPPVTPSEAYVQSDVSGQSAGRKFNVYATPVGSGDSASTLLSPSFGSSQRNIGNLSVPLPRLGNFDASFGILELRKAQFLQKYKEIRGSGNQTYANLVKKIFGVDIPDTLDTVPLYLGGGSSTISFSEVENTNLEGNNSATIKGKGTGGSSMRQIHFEPKENGCIMIIYHAQPVVDYALNALHFDVVRTEADDFANPIFDKLGFQEIPSWFFDQTMFGSRASGTDVPSQTTLGYTTRYFDYKTAVDRTLGDFRETSKTWLAPVDFDYLSNYTVNGKLMINANFFKVNPGILDPIFQLKATPEDNGEEGNYPINQPANLVSTDQLLVFANLDISVIRPLDKDGTPY